MFPIVTACLFVYEIKIQFIKKYYTFEKAEV